MPSLLLLKASALGCGEFTIKYDTMKENRLNVITCPDSVCWVHILVLVLVEIVEVVKRYMTLMPVKVDGV